MRTFVAAIFLALVAGPAFAQIGSFNLLPEDQKKTPEEIQRGEAIDHAYNEAIKKVPDQKKATNDPWADARGASPSPSAKKADSLQRKQQIELDRALSIQGVSDLVPRLPH